MLDAALFHRQVENHTAYIKSCWSYQPTQEQIYEFAEDLYSCTFRDLIDHKEVEAYKPKEQ